MADLVELGYLDGLSDALEIDADNTAAVGRYSVAGARGTVTGAWSAVTGAWGAVAAAGCVARASEAAGLRGLGFFFQEDLSDLLEERAVNVSTFVGLGADGHLLVSTASTARVAATTGVSTTARVAATTGVSTTTRVSTAT